MFLAFVSAGLLLATVGIHYEALRISSRAVPKVPCPDRMRVALMVVCILIAHLLEVVVFACGWAWLAATGHAGWETHGVATSALENFADYVYFSGSVYTSLGFGDIVPVGHARLLSVVEAVTGLVLIAWTASFTFLEMQLHWGMNGGGRSSGR